MLEMNQEEVNEMVEELQREVMPVMVATVTMVKGVLQLIEQDDEYFSLGASISKKSYDAYVAAGFTSEQAMELVLKSNPLQGLGQQQK